MLTTPQVELCKDYLSGKVNNRRFNILFCTYLNEYIAIHGYSKLLNEGETETYTHFCNYVLDNKIKSLRKG